VFENPVLKKIFRPNRDDGEEWWLIHNKKEFQVLYRSSSIVNN
jgi:hypothetical protein